MPLRYPRDGSGTLLRSTGLVGTVLMALGAWSAGAGIHRGDASPWGVVAWYAGLALLAAAWWPLATGEYQTDRRWLLTTGLIWALPLLFAPVTASRDVYSYACQGAIWLSGADPYAVGAAAGHCPWAGAVAPLWQQSPAPYGAVAIALSAGVVAAARALPFGADGTLVAAVTGFRLLALAAGVLIARYAPRLVPSGAPDRPVLALGLVTPLVAVHLVSGAHHDAVIAGLLVAALALGPRRAAVTGVLIGLAVGIKATALVALPFVAMLASAAPGRSAVPGRAPRWREAAVTVGAAGVTFAAATVGTGLGLGWVRALSGTGELVQWTSVPTAVGMAVGYLLRLVGLPEGYAVAVAVARVIGVVLLAGIGATLFRRAVRQHADPDAVRRYAAWGLAAVAVLSPVFYPWYALPALAVLAATGVRPRALAGATLFLAALVLPDGLGLAVKTKLPGAFAVVIAVIALVVVLRRAARAARRGDPATPTSTA